MNSKKKDVTMTLGMGKSGSGCYMVTPSGKKNVYCEFKSLKEFVEGNRDTVTFTMGDRDKAVQAAFEDPGEDVVSD